MQGITLKTRGAFQYLQFDAFTRDDLISHGFTCRRGGNSPAPYDNLNMALHVGDDPEHVRANRAVACRSLGINPAELVAADQIHGHGVQVVTREHRGRGATDYTTAIPGTDALITNEPGVPLSSYYADCVPILLFDPVKVVVGLAHAGWRGTVQRIAGITLEKMSSEFGSHPQDVLAGIGPSIGPCCYQVDLPVQQALERAFPYWRELLKPLGREYWLLDLWETNRRVLMDAGVLPDHITIANMCTACRPELFFSYRADRGKTGRMASLIMIKTINGEG